MLRLFIYFPHSLDFLISLQLQCSNSAFLSSALILPLTEFKVRTKIQVKIPEHKVSNFELHA